MAGNPELSGVWPAPSGVDVPLKPTIQMVFKGPGLIDPLSFNSGTFVVYGPGDVVTESGPGTILNKDIQTDPYTLIDGAVFRERIEGTYRVYTSGLPPISGIVTSGTLGVDGSLIIAEFLPAVPLNAYTEYTAVLVGEEAISWSTSSKIFPGVTTWTSEALFTPAGSGILTVTEPYSRTLPTALWLSGTGFNDTYRVEITSGTDAGTPKFLWSQLSDGTQYAGEGMGPHDLGEGLKFVFSGVFVSGDAFTLDVFIPQPLEKNFVWQFSTSDVSGNTPPVGGTEPNLIIDLTPGGGFGPAASTSDILLTNSYPDQMEYAVPSLPYILLQFDHTLSGVDVSGIMITQTPLLGMPNVPIISGGIITPTSIEVSGRYLKLWLE